MKKIPIAQAILVQKIAERRAERKRHKEERQKRLDQMHGRMDSAVRRDYKKWPQLRLPDNLSLTENYDKVVGIISKLRARIGKKKYINFNAIRQVDTAAVLMLAAELEINKIQSKTSKMTAHDSDWDPKVRTLLGQMGFLKLLSADSEMPTRTEPSKDQIFIKFRSGHKLIGETTKQMVDDLEESFTAGNLAPELRLHIYVGIFEAITNTRQHAYGNNNDDLGLKRWWISASVNTQNNEIKVVCYDRGKTIPKTIQDSKGGSKIINSLLQNVISGTPDDKILLTTIEQHISSTKEDYRGQGFSELLRLIDENNQGTLRIYSRKGMVKFSRPIKSGENSTFSRELPRKMHGTLVEWSIIPSSLTLTTEVRQNGITS